VSNIIETHKIDEELLALNTRWNTGWADRSREDTVRCEGEILRFFIL